MTTTLSASELVLDPALVRKYDLFGPRYTSYPTADRFHEAFTAEEYVNALHARYHRQGVPGSAAFDLWRIEGSALAQPLSLYVHVPFCNTICYYCACNKVITKDHGRSAKYIKYVGREVGIVSDLIEGAPRVEQIHLGGGTPTFLARDEMSALMNTLRNAFSVAPDAEISIEVDPRKVDAETIAFLGALGFNRISIGVQDFDPAVQKAINRIQSEAETRLVIDAARASGFVSVNADLIYGLPNQTIAGYSATLDKVIAASPDRIALYSYAHVPHLFKPQRRIDLDAVPAPETKLGILALAIERLGAAGYVYIGMDHFAKPSDELAVAQAQRKLHRNFQGYSTKPDCDLLAFGISAIGKMGASYVQNVRTLEEYYDRLDAHTLPVLRGVLLDADDLLRREVIQKLMCDFDLDFAMIEAKHGIRFTEYFARDLAGLAPLAADGLAEVSATGISVTPRGRLLVRTVAMQFDRYLRDARERAQYSRVI